MQGSVCAFWVFGPALATVGNPRRKHWKLWYLLSHVIADLIFPFTFEDAVKFPSFCTLIFFVAVVVVDLSTHK